MSGDDDGYFLTNKILDILFMPFLYLAFYLIKAYRYVKDRKWVRGKGGL